MRALRCALVIVALAFPGVAFAGETPLASVLSDPARFDEQRVTVRGTLTDLKAQRSRKGNRFYSFTLADGDHAVPIVVSKRPGCPAGSSVSVEGTVKHLRAGPGHTAVRIEATAVTCLGKKERPKGTWHDGIHGHAAVSGSVCGRGVAGVTHHDEPPTTSRR